MATVNGDHAALAMAADDLLTVLVNSGLGDEAVEWPEYQALRSLVMQTYQQVTAAADERRGLAVRRARVEAALNHVPLPRGWEKAGWDGECYVIAVRSGRMAHAPGVVEQMQQIGLTVDCTRRGQVRVTQLPRPPETGIERRALQGQ